MSGGHEILLTRFPGRKLQENTDGLHSNARGSSSSDASAHRCRSGSFIGTVIFGGIRLWLRQPPRHGLPLLAIHGTSRHPHPSLNIVPLPDTHTVTMPQVPIDQPHRILVCQLQTLLTRLVRSSRLDIGASSLSHLSLSDNMQPCDNTDSKQTHSPGCQSNAAAPAFHRSTRFRSPPV